MAEKKDKFRIMSRNEAGWFTLFIIGMGLIGAERGWEGVTWNVGMGTVGWVLGRILR